MNKLVGPLVLISLLLNTEAATALSLGGKTKQQLTTCEVGITACNNDLLATRAELEATKDALQLRGKQVDALAEEQSVLPWWGWMLIGGALTVIIQDVRK